MEEFIYSFGGFPDSPTLGIEKIEDKANAVAEIEHWLQEPNFPSLSPSPDGYHEGKVLTCLGNAEMDYLSLSIQEAGITSEFPQPVADFNLNSGEQLNHNNPSPSVSSFNDTAEVMGIQTIPCNDTILLSYDSDMMSPGSSSPKVLSVSPHPLYFDLPGPSSVESTSSVASNNQEAVIPVKKERKQRRRNTTPKKKMYEIEEPFLDPNEERKRKNAIKAHNNRQKKGCVFSKLEKENLDLRSALDERDKMIAELKKTILDINNTHSSHAAKLQHIRMIVNDKVML